MEYFLLSFHIYTLFVWYLKSWISISRYFFRLIIAIKLNARIALFLYDQKFCDFRKLFSKKILVNFINFGAWKYFNLLLYKLMPRPSRQRPFLKLNNSENNASRLFPKKQESILIYFILFVFKFKIELFPKFVYMCIVSLHLETDLAYFSSALRKTT